MEGSDKAGERQNAAEHDQERRSTGQKERQNSHHDERKTHPVRGPGGPWRALFRERIAAMTAAGGPFAHTFLAAGTVLLGRRTAADVVRFFSVGVSRHEHRVEPQRLIGVYLALTHFP